MKRPYPLSLPALLVLILSALLNTPRAAHALEVTVFGPEAVVKATGPVMEEIFHFPSPAGRAGFLRITNGLEDDIPNSQFVATTTITLNGQQVVAQGTLTPAVNALDVPVVLLSGDNVLGITLYGMPGGLINASVVALDEPPLAAFTATPQTGIVPLSVSFDAGPSADADGDITSYAWDFGDGQQAAGITTAHTYAATGSFTATLTVTDAFGLNDSTTQTVEVLPPPNSLSGRLLDTNAFAADGSEIPIVGAAVSLLGTGLQTTTDINGNFLLDGVPTGKQVLDLAAANANPAPDGSPYASFREAFTIAPGDNVVTRPFFLPRIDVTSLTTVDPAVTTVVTNPGLGITMTVAPGAALNEDGTPFTGQLSISEVVDGLAPATMPEEFEPGLLITIQPVGVRFSPPASIVFPNTDLLTPGTNANLWSLSPITGGFAIVGLGVVSAGGGQVDVVEGGIQAADWHFVLPPVPTSMGSNNNSFNITPELCTTCGGNPTVVMSTGDLGVRHTLPSSGLSGPLSELALTYMSGSASPRPTLAANVAYSEGDPVPPIFSTTLTVSGQSGQPLFTDTSALGTDEALHQRAQVDAGDLATGRYRYRMKLTGNFAASRVSAFIDGNVLVNNEKDSPLGAGWSISTGWSGCTSRPMATWSSPGAAGRRSSST